MATENLDILAGVPLFSQVERGGLKELARAAMVMHVDDGVILFQSGQLADGFYVVIDGEMEVFRSGPSMREQTLHVFGEGEICGEVPLFSGGTYPASARARGPLSVLYVPGNTFLDVAHRHPEMLLEMLAVLSRRLRHFTEVIAELSLKDVQARVAGYLLVMKEQQKSSEFDLQMSKRQLSAKLGTIQETLSRALGKLGTMGLITVKGRAINILDPEGLAAISDPSGQ